MISTQKKNKTTISLMIGKSVGDVNSILSCMAECKFNTRSVLSPTCKAFARALFDAGYEHVHSLHGNLYIAFYDVDDMCYCVIKKQSFDKSAELWTIGDQCFDNKDVRMVLKAVKEQIPLTKSWVSDTVLYELEVINGLNFDEFEEPVVEEPKEVPVVEEPKKILSRKLNNNIIKTNKVYKIQATVTSMQMRRLSVLGVEFDYVDCTKK